MSSTNNEKLFTSMLTKFWPNTKKYSNEYLVVNIDQIANCFISMDFSQPALHTIEKQFSFKFPKFWQKTKKYSNKYRGVNIVQSDM